ncbi:MAG: ankyrin repeat domain-containing protein [Rickettsiales bacterium]|jgi:ankyrin repeat protein|nr:ankyrin repeat domain-containing protein [Rickettsiales bacterium]
MSEEINRRLLDCVYKNDVQGVAKTISEGADINYTNLYGETALHIASINGYKDLAKLLLSKNSRIQQKDDIGLTPLDWAERRSKEGVAIEIRSHKEKQKQYQDRWNSVYNTLDSVYKAGIRSAYEKGAYAYDIIDRLAKDLVGEPSKEDVRYQSQQDMDEHEAEQTFSSDQKDTSLPNLPKSKTATPSPRKQHAPQAKSSEVSWGVWGAEKFYNVFNAFGQYATRENPTYKFTTKEDAKLNKGEARVKREGSKIFVEKEDGTEFTVEKGEVSEELFEKLSKVSKSEEVIFTDEEARQMSDFIEEKERKQNIPEEKGREKSKNKEEYAPNMKLLNAELHRAAEKDNIESMEHALNRGADINSQNKFGNTVLHNAASKENLETIDFLLSCGADPNITNKRKETALHVALSTEMINIKIPIINIMLEKGADLNAQDINGNSPMHFAALSSDDVIDIMLDGDRASQVDMNLRNNRGDTALNFALELGDDERIEKLCTTKIDTNALNNDQESSLAIALKHGASDRIIAKLLPTDKAVYSVQDAQGNSIMHHAIGYGVRKGKTGVVTSLMKNGGDIDIENYKGVSPRKIGYNYAMNEGTETAIEINRKKRLHQVALSGDETQIKKLAAKGANLDQQDELGNTPGHYALLSDNEDNFYVLTEDLGADIDIKNNKGISLRDVIESTSPEKANELIREVSKDIESIFYGGSVADHEHNSEFKEVNSSIGLEGSEVRLEVPEEEKEVIERVGSPVGVNISDKEITKQSKILRLEIPKDVLNSLRESGAQCVEGVESINPQEKGVKTPRKGRERS